MGTLKLDRLPAYLRSPDPSTRAFLIHGPDAGRIREAARAIVAALAGSADDPFGVTHLGEDDLAGDPGRLADEVNAISFTGGTRTVWVKDAGPATLKALATLLVGEAIAGTVIAEAGVLAKSSPLRTLVEKSPRGLAIACYEDEVGDLRGVIAEMVKREGFGIDPGAMEFLCARLGSDRSQTRSEIVKLLTYCHGGTSIDLEDVEAVCSDGQTGTIDRLLDAAMEGDTGLAARSMDELNDAGAYPAALLSALAGHIARLGTLQAAAAQVGPEAAMRSARPPVFYKRQPSHLRQLRLWPSDRLDAAAATVFEAILQTRRFAQLDRVIAERAVLALAMRAQRMRAA
jgi:DNA polymerase-3 subunit delta